MRAEDLFRDKGMFSSLAWLRRGFAGVALLSDSILWRAYSIFAARAIASTDEVPEQGLPDQPSSRLAKVVLSEMVALDWGLMLYLSWWVSNQQCRAPLKHTTFVTTIMKKTWLTRRAPDGVDGLGFLLVNKMNVLHHWENRTDPQRVSRTKCNNEWWIGACTLGRQQTTRPSSYRMAKKNYRHVFTVPTTSNVRATLRLQITPEK